MDINLTTLFWVALAAAVVYFIIMTAVDRIKERDEDQA